MTANRDRALFGSGSGGFTLVEVIISVGIFATVALGIVGLLAAGTDAVRDNGSKNAAHRLVGGLKERLSDLGFDRVYGILRDDPKTDFFLYHYAGDLTGQRPDGTAMPVVDFAGGDEFRRETGFRSGDDAFLADDLVASLGPVFRIRMTPLPADPGADAAGYSLPNLSSYKFAGLRVFARFYLEPSADIAGQRPLESLTEVLTVPMMVPR